MKAPTVIPAVIPKSRAHLAEAVQSIAGVASLVQIDIVDGVFVPFVSWPCDRRSGELAAFIREGGLPSIAPLSYELDLMITAPELSIHEWLKLGADRIIIHIKSTEHVATVIDTVHAAGKEIGLAIDNDTALEKIEPYIPSIDLVQCMGIVDIGQQGQPFDTRVLERIRTLRARYPELPISVDGSVNAKTIVQLRDAGATRFVSGSAIFAHRDPVQAYQELTASIDV